MDPKWICKDDIYTLIHTEIFKLNVKAHTLSGLSAQARILVHSVLFFLPCIFRLRSSGEKWSLDNLTAQSRFNIEVEI